MLPRERHRYFEEMAPHFDSIELRFVDRVVTSDDPNVLSGLFRILQYRHRRPYMDGKDVRYHYTEWQDVPVEEEDDA